MHLVGSGSISGIYIASHSGRERWKQKPTPYQLAGNCGLNRHGSIQNRYFWNIPTEWQIRNKMNIYTPLSTNSNFCLNGSWMICDPQCVCPTAWCVKDVRFNGSSGNGFGVGVWTGKTNTTNGHQVKVLRLLQWCTHAVYAQVARPYVAVNR